jgi:ribose/xylose/arabinose/galactoside ABC-type transport system permease subunit
VVKTKLAMALLGLGLSVGTCIGYGVLRIPQPRLMFDLMMLLTFVGMLIWTIKKRHVNEKAQRARNVRGPAKGVNNEE